MSSVIDTIGTSVGLVLPQSFSASPPTGSSPSFAPVAASQPPAGAAVNSTDDSFTPRVILDPSAGFITQYLSANGSEVVSQTPSAITVAYLQQGLTAGGDPKAPAYQSVGTVA